jgi:hypothetical protein
VLDAPERLHAARGGILDTVPDAELQALVHEAARGTGWPIAVVSLVLRRTQLFRAQTGLPADLAVSGATDRCTSFCQFVVASGRKLEVEDAVQVPWLPQELVRAYGIRAYAGEPVRVDGHVLGSLCVIDAQPRQLSDAQRVLLKSLADQASLRLELLARAGRTPEALSRLQALALEPAFGEARNLLSVLSSGLEYAQMALAELSPALRLAEAASHGGLAPEELARGFRELGAGARGGRELAETLADVGSASARLADLQVALEATLGVHPLPARDTLESVVEGASRAAAHVTRVVGGVRWTLEDGALPPPVRARQACSALAAALRALAEGLAGRAPRGIDARALSGPGGELRVWLRAPAADGPLLEAVEGLLRPLLGGAAEAEVALVDGALELSWPAVGEGRAGGEARDGGEGRDGGGAREGGAARALQELAPRR